MTELPPPAADRFAHLIAAMVETRARELRAAALLKTATDALKAAEDAWRIENAALVEADAVLTRAVRDHTLAAAMAVNGGTLA